RGLRAGSSRECAPRSLQLATAPGAREGPREVLVVFWRNLLALSEGLRPSDSPTGSLARRFAGSLRSPGSLAVLARVVEREADVCEIRSSVATLSASLCYGTRSVRRRPSGARRCP